MKENKKSRKRNAGELREKKRTLLDLGPAADPRDELPTNPGVATRSRRITSLPPAPEEQEKDVSLESLSHATFRTRFISAIASPPAPPAPPLAPTSTMPPPVESPSEPPKAEPPARLGLRVLGLVVLSASVGALVASLTWGVHIELMNSERRSATAGAPAAVVAARCDPTAASAPTGVATEPLALPTPKAPMRTASAIASPTPEAPRVSIDTLPLLGGARERAALAQSRRVQTGSDKSALRGETRPVPLRSAPSRAAIVEAVSRAAYASSSCSGGPESGRVSVTFLPSGSVDSVSLLEGFDDAAVNGCVLRAFGRARIPAFAGEKVQVRKSLSW